MYCSEFELLLLSVRPLNFRRSVETAEKIIQVNTIDWENLYERARIHSVRPQLANLLSNVSVGFVPEDFLDKINSAWRSNLYDQLGYMSEFFRVKRLLDAEGIRVVPFKGFWLANEIYDNPGDRESGDVDLYFNIEELEMVIRIMTGNGYLIESHFQDYSLEEIIKGSGEYNFDRFENNKCVSHFEFHWGISLPVYGMAIDINDMEGQISKGSLQNHEILSFSPSANFLLMIMHHGGDDRYTSLKQVLDVALFLKKQYELDWDWILDTARRFKLENVVFAGVRLASEICGIDIPNRLAQSAGASEIKRLAAERLSCMARDTVYRSTVRFNFDNWLFRMRSRTGIMLKFRITLYTMRLALTRIISSAKSQKYLLFNAA